MVELLNIEVPDFGMQRQILAIRIVDRFGHPQGGVEYILSIGDGERRGWTDVEGWIKESGVRADDVTIRLADHRILYIPENQEELSALTEVKEEETEAESETTEVDEFTIPRARLEIFEEDELLEEYYDLFDDEDDYYEAEED